MNHNDIKKMSQDDFVVNENDREDAVRQAEQRNTPPADYIKVKLSSVGKLNAPAILYFRDYTLAEVYDLAQMNRNADNEDEVLIGILNKLVWGDFDCGKLHREEVIEIMLNIYNAFYSPNIESHRYYVNEDLEGRAKEAKENISIATIPISAIQTKELPKEFKEPFYLSKDKDKYGFVLPRVENSIIAKNYIEELFALEEKQFSDIKVAIEFNRNAPEDRQKHIDYGKLELYKKYIKRKVSEKLKIYQAMTIHSVNGKEIGSLEEKLKIASGLGLKLWTSFNKVIETQLNFGVNREVEFVCSVTGKKITRRFQFRELDFIPTVDNASDPEYTLSFS